MPQEYVYAKTDLFSINKPVLHVHTVPIFSRHLRAPRVRPMQSSSRVYEYIEPRGVVEAPGDTCDLVIIKNFPQPLRGLP